ncbi:MAG: Gfo/Idh/MocA family protein [Candidatus Hodarchaeales archaeon]|jgi:predicted dehydrogenase
MKLGIIGLGSIGQRHIRCLGELGYKEIFALRTRKGTIEELPDDLKYVKQYLDPDHFYSLDLDGVIISNPTSLHIETMKEPLQRIIPIFIEKPIADSLEQMKKIQGYDVSNVMVGYCLRYNKIINVIKDYISSGKLGEIHKANLYSGHFLPLWHPYADYRLEYYARKDLGGGVLRTLSHEIDLMHYLFGRVKELFALVEKISNLEIDVDDNVFMICKMINNAYVTIELDFLNPLSSRKGNILGSKGKLEYCFSKLSVTFTDYDAETKTLYENPNLDPNKMYLDQMKAFINFIHNRKGCRGSFEDGLNVMKIIKAAEDSTRSKSWQNLEEG